MRRPKTKLTEAAVALLKTKHNELIATAAVRFGTTEHEVRNPHEHKKQPESHAREWIMCELRAVVFYQDGRSTAADGTLVRVRHVAISETFRNTEPGDGWHRCSTPMIARAMHYGDHSAVVLALQRADSKAALAELSAQYVDPVADKV